MSDAVVKKLIRSVFSFSAACTAVIVKRPPLDFRAVFALIDSHDTGTVAKMELVKLFADSGGDVSIDHVNAFMNTEAEGIITRAEFSSLMEAAMETGKTGLVARSQPPLECME